MLFSSVDILEYYREQICEEMFKEIEEFPRTPYLNYFLQDLGRERAFYVLGLIVKAMEGKPGEFFEDQAGTSKDRAVSGYRFEETITPIRIAKKFLIDFVDKKSDEAILLIDAKRDLLKLYDLFYDGIIAIAVSFLKTREDQINEKVRQLQSLQNFTKCILKSLKLDELTKIILTQLGDIFHNKDIVLALSKEQITELFLSDSIEHLDNIYLKPIHDTLNEKNVRYADSAGRIYGDHNSGSNIVMIAVPIEAHGKTIGALALLNTASGIKFSEKEMEFLYQFVDIMSISLENALILEQLEKSHDELRMLAQHIIMVQEKERKRLAGDIHDTLAQSLTSINYKIQYCKELFKLNPEKLLGQFNHALKMTNDAINQSRALISSLRPNLIDIMGLIPALEQFFKTFEGETGIKVAYYCPAKVQLSSDLNMCIFRVVQEAMTNVSKHAEAKNIEFRLNLKGENLEITISDDGKGFKKKEIKNTNSLGLLLMKERIESFNGTLSIESEYYKGCRIKASVPLGKKSK
ncbi:MAG: sensor histidine kinase [Syntrophaceae bacterium]